MDHHPTVQRIKNLLEEHNCEFQVLEHAPVRTSEEAAKVRTGYTLHQGTKSMICKVKEPGVGKRFVMFVVPGDAKFDKNKIEHNFHFKDIRFATEDEVKEITNGILPGGVPPFGNLFGLEAIVDESVFENERIIFNAGDRSVSITIRSADYRAVVNPKVGNIV